MSSDEEPAEHENGSDSAAEHDDETTAEPSVFESIAVGETYTTGGRTITGADVTNFAGVSGDFNHVHTDAERMRNTQFGDRIAHGMLVLSAATGLVWQTRSERVRDAVVAFYGIDRLRFVAPVFVGDTIRLVIEVAGKEPRDHPVGNGVVRYEIDVRNQRDETVLACETLSLLR